MQALVTDDKCRQEFDKLHLSTGLTIRVHRSVSLVGASKVYRAAAAQFVFRGSLPLVDMCMESLVTGCLMFRSVFPLLNCQLHAIRLSEESSVPPVLFGMATRAFFCHAASEGCVSAGHKNKT